MSSPKKILPQCKYLRLRTLLLPLIFAIFSLTTGFANNLTIAGFSGNKEIIGGQKAFGNTKYNNQHKGFGHYKDNGQHKGHDHDSDDADDMSDNKCDNLQDKIDKYIKKQEMYNCTPPPVACSSCGDGIIDPTEECDDGNTVSGDGCSGIACDLEFCGDGVYVEGNTINEECDDGNNNNGDGCSSTCTIEPTYNLLPGDYIIDMQDSYGDGWQGADATTTSSSLILTTSDQVVQYASLCDAYNLSEQPNCVENGSTGQAVLTVAAGVTSWEWKFLGDAYAEIGFTITCPNGKVIYDCAPGGCPNGADSVLPIPENACTDPNYN